MTFAERIRWAVEPNQERSMALLVCGTAVFLALGGIAAWLEPPPPVRMLMAIGMLAGWTVGFCGVVGFLRWFVRDALDRAKKEKKNDDPR